MTKVLELRNISTILTSIFLTIFGLIIGYATSRGINLPFNAEIATSITVGAILFVFSYYNAKHHNNLFDKDTDTIYIPVDNLDDAHIQAINEFINEAIDKNLKHKYGNWEGEIDPAEAYESGDDVAE